MVRIAGGDQAANGGLGGAVGLGDGVEGAGPRLVLLRELAAEEGQGRACGLMRQFDGEGFQFGHAEQIHRPSSRSEGPV
ncbi:hypothetical protein D3C78_1799890 [compost metagenome]